MLSLGQQAEQAAKPLAKQPKLPGNGNSSVAGVVKDPEGHYIIAGSTSSTDLSASGFQKQIAGSGCMP